MKEMKPMKIKSLCYLLSILLMLIIATPVFAQDAQAPDQSNPDTTVIVPESPKAPPAEVQPPADTTTAPDAEDQKNQDDQTKKTTQTKKTAKAQKAAASQQATVQATAADSGTGEVTLGSTTFVAPPSPDNSTFTGAASYSVPIVVPPGRNGLAPKIALTYNSQRGNSWVGVGWDIDLGAIRRSTKREVDYSKNDFVFSSAGQSYDLVGRTNVWGANYYGAKAEEDFSKYYLSNNSWVVTAKDGTKYYYGSTDASRQFSGNNIFQWYLDKIEDTNGNYISITYTTYPTTDPGQLYPLEIKYTGHISGLQPTNSIKFILEDRTDKILSYVPHFKTLMTKRLQAVEIYAGTAFVRRYVLAHSSSPTTHRTLVQSVTEIGSDNSSSLPPITFTYQDGGTTGIDSFTKLPKYYGWFDQMIGFTGSKTVNTTTGDQNGDGLEDIYCETRKETSSSTYDSGAFLVSQGNGEFNTIASTNRVFSGSNCLGSNDPNNSDCQERTLGDINGDGKVEFIERPIDSDTYQPFSALDINGDGYADLYFEEGHVVKYSEHTGITYDYIAPPYFQLGKGDGTFYSTHIGVPFPSCTADPVPDNGCPLTGCPEEKCRTLFGDFNGDGILDIISIPHPFYFNKATLYFGKGNGTFDSITLTDANLKEAVGTVDINNDGFADLRLSDGKFLIGKGDGTFESSPTNFETDTGFLGSGGAKYIFGDFDGDGRQDLLTPGAIYFANAKPYPDLLFSVTNSMGGSAAITYQPSTAYQDPSQSLPFPIQVVSSITTNDGLGNQITTNYTYSGGLYDHTEREFQGFATVTKINPDGSKELTQFNQDYYLKGKPKLTQLIAPAVNGGTETLLSQTTFTWETASLASGVTFVRLNQKRTESYDAETVFSQEVYNYDGTNGNLLSTVSSGTDAENVTKTSQYANYGAWTWRTTQEALTDSTNVRLRQTDYTYDNNIGNLLTKTAWRADLPSASPVITYQYDAYGNVLKAFDAKGNPPIEVVYETQAYTYPQYIYNPLRHWVEYEVDPRYGYAKKKIDRSNNNNTIEYTYDPFGRLTLTQNPDGGSTEIFYSDVSDPNVFPRYIRTRVWETATSYIPAYAYFDGFGRQVQTSSLGENNQSIITQTHYDNMGRTDLTTGPFFGSNIVYPQTPPAAGYPFTWTSLFDFRGRPVTVLSKSGDYPNEYITTSFAYSGFRTTVTDPDGSIIREVKDYLGRIIRVREWLMDNGVMTITITNYAYNAAGDLIKVTDNQGNITTLSYDTLGLKRDMIDPDMGHWTYNYDKNGNLTNQFDAKNQEIRFAYDPLNRVLSKNYYINNQLSTVDSPVANVYDLAPNGVGRPYTSTKGNIVITSNTYDSMGRNLKITKKIDTTNFITQNQYDLSGKVTKLTYPNNTDTTVVTNEYYPGTNLLKQVVTNSVITALYTDYAPTGKIGQITYPNGIYTFYNYDAWSAKLFGIVTTNNPANTDPTKDLQNREYTYSRAGDILQIQDNAKGITYDYTYDMLHRLVGETLGGTGAPVATKVETITLDYSGTTGPVHGVKTITLNGISRTCQYDANGNMITSPDFTTPANPLNRAITYDADNMPITIAHANGTTVNFVYDSVAKRTKKLVAGGKTVLYLGDHFEVENGTAIKYIFGGNLRLAQIKGSLTSYFHKDHLGSTAAITDQNGNKVEGTTYEPFGSTRAHEGTDISAYKFTDQELDNETGLYNYDARLYDPVLGMFVTSDSIVQDMFDPQYLNRYSYCRNNPLIYTDPSGHGTGTSRPGGSDENVNGKGGLQPSGPYEGSWEEHYGWGDPKFSEKTFRIPGGPAPGEPGYEPPAPPKGPVVDPKDPITQKQLLQDQLDRINKQLELAAKLNKQLNLEQALLVGYTALGLIGIAAGVIAAGPCNNLKDAINQTVVELSIQKVEIENRLKELKLEN
jgi:RHS repeat-associated protein